MRGPISLWHSLTHGCRVLLWRDRADADLDAELQHFLAEASTTPAAGELLRAREDIRDAGWEESIALILRDIAYAVRRLRTDGSFTAVVVVTLAMGVGATTAIFSTVNPILLRPLPYPHADRIVSIADRRTGGGLLDVTFGTYRELAARSRAFDTLAVFKPWQPTLTGDGASPERLDGQRVSAGFLRTLGIVPEIGRDFDDGDDRPRGPNVVILGNGLWRRRFGGDPAIVGRQVRIDGSAFTVIGVMPVGFQIVQAPMIEAWAPLQYDPSLPADGREWGHHLQLVARLVSRADVTAARRDADEIASHPVPEFRRVPWARLEQSLAVTPLQDDLVRGVRPALLAIVGAVLLVLLAACVNVTNLLLARGAQRRGEFAMRAALGASRGRLVRQLVIESIVLALAGGAAGVFVAAAGVRALVVLAPAGLPRVDAIRFDASAFAFAMLVSTLVGLLVGLVPAWQATRRDARDGLRHASRTVAGHRGTRSALVVAEVGLALVLLVVAGLLLRSLQQLFAVDTGFNPSHVLTLQVHAAGQGPDPAAVRRFFDAALTAVQRLQGVERAGWTSQLPLTGDFDKYGAPVEADVAIGAATDRSALRYAVTPGYFDAMGIGLRRGRLIDSRDRAGAPVAVVVSQSFVQHRLPGLEPIGQHLHLGRTDVPWYTIVGVVGDVKQASLSIDDGDAVYVMAEQWAFADPVMSLAVRTAGDPAAIAASVRNAIWSVDADEAIVRVATLDALVAASAAERRFALLIFESFALVALMLAATGIYGVLSGSVTERVREIGVRAALGASRADILSLVLGEGLTLTAIGVVCGAVAAAVAARAVSTLLFGISPLDAVTYAAVVALLGAVSTCACWAPAWRASRVDPASMLRAD